MSSAVQLQPHPTGTPENSDTMSRSDVALQDATKTSTFAAHNTVLAKENDEDGNEHAELEDKDQPQSKSCWSFFACCFATKKPPQKPPVNGDHEKPYKKPDDPIPMQPRPAPPVVAAPPPPNIIASVPNPNETKGAPDMITSVPQGPQVVPPPNQPFTNLRPPPTKCLLPPLPENERHKKTLVLDLDETLVHSSFKPIPNADFVISIELENVIHRVFVLKRPGVDAFLREVGRKFDVVVFTASLAKYADPLLDILDRNKVVKTRLFREACVHHYGNYVKDLSHLGRRLEDTIIIDNSPFSYMFQPDNAIPITSWFNDKNDRQLYDLLPFLDSITTVEDVCTVLHRRKALQLQQGAP